MDGGSGKSGSSDVLHNLGFTLEGATLTVSTHNDAWPCLEDVRVAP